LICIIDYKAGNAPSVLCAAEKLGFAAKLVSKPQELDCATHIILPGVGSAGATMRSLAEMGMLDVLEEKVLRGGTLFLGICVGMQVLFAHSAEENTDCLGWLGGRVVRFEDAQVKVPQIGWNQVTFAQAHSWHEAADYFYFVNSYYAVPDDESVIWGTADYNGTFTAAVHKDNIYATQFHTEKSGEAGLALLRGFLTQRKEG